VNETAAQEVLLVRAVERADTQGKLLTEDDRRFAGRTAAELVRWRAADRGERPSGEAFVAKRAELLAGKLAERAPRAGRMLKAMRWRPWIGAALPAIAFVLGLLVDRIADPGRVNILAFPLLGIIVWNLAVYISLVARTVRSLARHAGRKPGWLQQLLAGARSRLSLAASGPLAEALARFGFDWGERSMPLVAARASRILHLSAAALALGAVAGLYVRGLAFEYRAGWESTFLEADSVHALLTLFLGPSAALIGQPLPTVDALAALRWSAAGGGENAGRWIYLYAVTVALVVIVPRLVLGLIASVRERRLSARFPLSLDEAYFRRVLSQWREAPAHVRVQPYSYTVDEPASEGMQRLLSNLFGDTVQVYWARPVAFGEEDSMRATPEAQARPADLVIALFNLSATPETENHGVFLDKLKSQTPGTLVMLVDQGPYRERLGTQAGAEARLAERREAWSGFGATRNLRAVFADLAAADFASAQTELDAQISSGTQPS